MVFTGRLFLSNTRASPIGPMAGSKVILPICSLRTNAAAVSNIGISINSPCPTRVRRYKAKPIAWALTKPVIWSVITKGTKRGSPLDFSKVAATPADDWITVS